MIDQRIRERVLKNDPTLLTMIPVCTKPAEVEGCSTLKKTVWCCYEPSHERNKRMMSKNILTKKIEKSLRFRKAQKKSWRRGKEEPEDDEETNEAVQNFQKAMRKMSGEEKLETQEL